jgi:hypothetical protein
MMFDDDDDEIMMMMKSWWWWWWRLWRYYTNDVYHNEWCFDDDKEWCLHEHQNDTQSDWMANRLDNENDDSDDNKSWWK